MNTLNEIISVLRIAVIPLGTIFRVVFCFTKMIYELEGIKCKVTPVTSEEFKSAAKRPKNSQMSKDKLLKYGIEVPTYEDALKRYLKKE